MSALAHEPAVILIIDNDPIMLTGIAAVLNMSGYECHCARNAQAARKAIKSLALDLIVCDVDLGPENGLELCRELRQLPGIEDVPMMFISAAQAPDIVRRSHDAGGSYYLRKPFDPEVLIELVSKALWMPHLVQSRVAAMPEPIAEPAPATPVVPRSNLRHALSGIRMPMA
ncbi:Gliding motility regulatory protein [Anatilimnocola aggregata]|uniref:Gliding motility regulatory protein n=1 Tax=Anatilimnocola aggregata TaxID=2528021 RepID=A0A517YEW2_9BACT|nr:response regulator [Anatilimnocola aggregata]QDU28763.1 Gliding motility regulatory protein [Anatilimnocola aggregata]